MGRAGGRRPANPTPFVPREVGNATDLSAVGAPRARSAAQTPFKDYESGETNMSTRRMPPLSMRPGSLFLSTIMFAGMSATALPARAQTYQTIRVVDPVVNNTDPNLANNEFQSDSENSIAINPANPNELVVLGFAETFT